MDLGILVYIDNSEQMLEEFGWLYKSLIHPRILESGGVVAVCHPEIAGRLPEDPRIETIPSAPYAERNPQWAGYGYINSVANLAEPVVLEACSRFPYVLKTDCDTFVTPALKHFRPSGLCAGFGAYAYEESVRTRLSEISMRWGYPHTGLYNVGASVLGPTEWLRNYLVAQRDACNRLLDEEFRDFQGQWPGWCKQVLTMYAGELALRLTYPQGCSLGLLDHFSFADRKLGSDVLHIHAWHTDAYWSKHRYRNGEYAHMTLSDIDTSIIGGYCHWLAAAPLEEVKRRANESR
ncbi:hypothetical protein P9239_22870 [Caballeronia sp. LZ062]|uniref:DUF7164 domain-containing protein n=1 Tax=unclassified Caballeronia TaxID=2646786 RepID=UPI00285E0BA4|nr:MULTISPECIES: hypothetical protein [unclassified Caballeronia]MDR5856529.1 hypothetical protein [Caballeronia sp. LZ050]MDR5873199.1 hypothetical protein [Caballeronia sp. LZ062]